MGAKTKARALFLTLLAATILSLVGLVFRLENWASVANLPSLHVALHLALVLVIIGVIAEESELIKRIALFVALGFRGEVRYALSRACVHRGEIAKGAGFIILTVGLSAEIILDPAIESAQGAIEAKADGDLQAQKTATTQALERATRVEQATAWRSLPRNVQENLAQSLSVLPGGTIEVSWPAYDDESFALAIEFIKVIDTANTISASEKWKISEQPRLFAQVIFFGTSINGTNNSLVYSVRRAFAALGIPAGKYPVPNILLSGPGETVGGVDPTDVQIWVGTKPRPL